MRLKLNKDEFNNVPGKEKIKQMALSNGFSFCFIPKRNDYAENRS